jgi:AcrR family transcriptional regulator
VSTKTDSTGERAGAPEAPARGRGRPRSEEAHRAILMATMKLLPEHGLAGLTMEAVAAEAGVGKTTIYRRWSTKNDLVVDALSMLRPDVEPPDTGSLRGDLREMTRIQVERLGDTNVPRMIPRIIAESADEPELHRLIKERAVEPIRDILRTFLRRAIERGEIRDDLDIEAMTDMIHALPVYQVLMTGGDLHAIEPMADLYLPMMLEGLAPSSSSATPGSARPRSSGSSRAKRARSG